jgi:hypothetical protein
MEQGHDRHSFKVLGHCLSRVSACEAQRPIGLTWIKEIKNAGRQRPAGIDRDATFA